jgi:hypothetical protein
VDKNVQISCVFALSRVKRILASPRLSVRKSAHLSTGIKSAFAGRISVKFDTGDVYQKSANEICIFLISNFRPVLYVLCSLLGNSPASEFYMPTFRNTLLHLHRQSFHTYLPIKMEQSTPKRRHKKFRRRGITQKKTYKIYILLKLNKNIR